MAADDEAKQLGFRFQTFTAGRLIERDSRQLFQTGRRDEPALVCPGRSAAGLQEMLRLPELARAGFAEFIECADANHRFEFLARRRNAMEEVGHRREGPALACREQRIRRARREPFDAR